MMGRFQSIWKCYRNWDTSVSFLPHFR